MIKSDFRMRFQCNLLDMNTHKILERLGFGGNRLSLTFQSSLSLILGVKLVVVSLEQALLKIQRSRIIFILLFYICIRNESFFF